MNTGTWWITHEVSRASLKPYSNNNPVIWYGDITARFIVLHIMHENNQSTILGSGAKAMPVQWSESCLALMVNLMLSLSTVHSAA